MSNLLFDFFSFASITFFSAMPALSYSAMNLKISNILLGSTIFLGIGGIAEVQRIRASAYSEPIALVILRDYCTS